MIKESEIAWMAGIIDMKGIILEKQNKTRATPQIVLYIETKHIHIINELNRLTGTKIEMFQRKLMKTFMRRECSDHCPEPHTHVGDERVMPQVARWTITGTAMVVILKNVYPYLVDKKNYEEVITMLMEQAVLTGQGSGMTNTAIRRLYFLGWNIPEEFESALE